MKHRRKLFNKAMREKVASITHSAVSLTMTLVMAASALIGSLAPAVAYADEAQQIIFANGGTAMLQPDGSITGTCVLTDCSTTTDGYYYYYHGSNIHMPDGQVLWGLCYEEYIGVPNHYDYDGPVNGTTTFTATPNGDGSYFVLVHSQDMQGCFGRDKTQQLYNVAWTPEWPGTISLEKVSANASITSGNRAYSLEGAVYGIYSDAGCSTLVGTMKTDAKGKASSEGLVSGTYYVKETAPSPGHALDDTVYAVEVKAGKNTVVNGKTVAEPPLNDPTGLIIQKVDAETGSAVAAGASSLEGAEYTYLFFAGDYYTKADDGSIVDSGGNVIIDADGNVTGDTVDRTWVVATNSNGYADLSDQYLVSSKSDDLYYYDGIATLPIGTVVVFESSAPTGYMVSDSIYVMQVSDGGGTAVATGDISIRDGQRYVGTSEGTQEDQVIRGDLSFTKVNGLTDEHLSGIPFLITSTTTGESHVVVTDANGMVSTSSEFNSHLNNTNANDAAVSVDEDGNYVVDESLLDSTAGVWFSGYADTETDPDDSVGALPYDTYTIEELPVSANESFGLVSMTVVVSRNGFEIDFGTVDDNYLGIGTTASAANGEAAGVGEAVTITDTVQYEGLTPGDTYTLVGTLMDAETGEAVTDDNGNAVTSTVEFTPVQISGTVEVEFVFDTTGIQGHDVVVFEKLYDASDKLIASHEDIEDEGQTVEVKTPEVGTIAASITGSSEVGVGETVTIIDTVEYSGLNPGETYTVTGTLMDKETGEALTYKDTSYQVLNAETGEWEDLALGRVYDDAGNYTETTLLVFDDGTYRVCTSVGVLSTDENGNSSYTVERSLTDYTADELQVIEGEEELVVTATAEFVPETSDGTVEVEFTVDTTALAGKSIVVFEELASASGTVIGTHEDIEDEGQTVVVETPEIGTTATSEDGEKNLAFDNEVTLVDTIVYSGLDAGETYTVTGTLMDKETGEALLDADGNTVTTTATFVPSAESGTTAVTFTLDTTELGGKDLVVFENLYSVSGTLVASHEDIEDEGQTVTVVQPEIGTTLVDATDGDHEATPSTTTKLIDTVEYTGLVPGKSYTIEGVLMDQSTGEPILVNDQEVTASTTFVPNSSDGTVEVVFEFDSTALEGTNVVAFEYAYYDDLLVASHEDLSDMNQTVEITSTPDGTVYDKTGGDFGFVPGLVAGALIAAAALASYSVIQKRRAAKDAKAEDSDDALKSGTGDGTPDEKSE